ncbi:hypothetical protein H6G83_31935 [Anabaena azotica FACHB-119]|uniref:Uncharacterized protein n=1 Tax=Anabaena azotica FACHB-119 TaxID=947527 RepID=A0ABR8DGC1_9NOST|nr:hypothetical protein [Anabaena azotica FACHB-119]
MTASQKAYRGRVQAQGDDISQNGGYSYSWARMTPVTEQEGLSFIATIQAQCNKSQQAERQQAFSKAKRFVQNASKQGGIGPEAQPHSFKNTKRTVDNARVDIEIASGLTFVPEKSS